jgi:hypothetical protein
MKPECHLVDEKLSPLLDCPNDSTKGLVNMSQVWDVLCPEIAKRIFLECPAIFDRQQC